MFVKGWHNFMLQCLKTCSACCDQIRDQSLLKQWGLLSTEVDWQLKLSVAWPHSFYTGTSYYITLTSLGWKSPSCASPFETCPCYYIQSNGSSTVHLIMIVSVIKTALQQIFITNWIFLSSPQIQVPYVRVIGQLLDTVPKTTVKKKF